MVTPGPSKSRGERPKEDIRRHYVAVHIKAQACFVRDLPQIYSLLTLNPNHNLAAQAMSAELVDLIYLDPPFNSNASYNVLYGTKRGGPSQAQSPTFTTVGCRRGSR